MVLRLPRWRLGACVLGVGGGLVLGGPARAIDGVRPRTVMLWPDDTPCMVVVDRTVDPVVNLAYAIPFEDPEAGASITEDEVDDGRRHQAFAFSQDIDPRLSMPEWISWADVTRAADAGLVDASSIEAQWVLEDHAVLGGSFVRIVADDARRPITFAAADAGIDWDTSGVAPGTYVVRGYTWDPWPNAWAHPRHGVVRVLDDAEDPTLVPALAVATAELILHRDQVGTIEGCLAAPPGTTLSAAWADFTTADAPFVEFAAGIVADDGVVAIPFAPPEAVWGKPAIVRVTAIDPSGLRYDAFVPEELTILASDAPSDCEDPGSGDSGCTTSGDDTDASDDAPASASGGDGDTSSGAPATTTSGADATIGAPAQPPARANEGCTCSGSASGEGWGALALAWLLVRRRARTLARVGGGSPATAAGDILELGYGGQGRHRAPAAMARG